MQAKRQKPTPAAMQADLHSGSQVNVVERAGRLFVNVELPGVSADEIDVRISEGLLDICAGHEAAAAGVRQPFGTGVAGLIGSSREFSLCLQSLREAAATEASVMLCGETGTGKELFALAIHQNSGRAGGNFVAVDCTVLPDSLVGSLLFGHEKGAFTGADQSCEGLIRQAHCGTLFLDEVGELSPTLQKAFLRVLQEHRFRPIGRSEEVESDFRLIASTNCNLTLNAARGQFRQDLLYRLQSCLIELPPLRHRRQDIHALARYHADRLCQMHHLSQKRLSPDFLHVLSCYSWPGNVRELINALELALCTAPQETTLFAKHLPQSLRIQVAKASLEQQSERKFLHTSSATPDLPPLQDFRAGVLSLAEKQYLSKLVRQVGQNVGRACQLSGLSRSRLYSLLKKHRLSLH